MCIYVFADGAPLQIRFVSETLTPTFWGSNIIVVDLLARNTSLESINTLYVLYPNSNFNLKSEHKIERIWNEETHKYKERGLIRGVFADCSAELTQKHHPHNASYNKRGWKFIPLAKSDSPTEITITRPLDKPEKTEQHKNDNDSDYTFKGNFIAQPKIIPIDEKYQMILKDINFMLFRVDLTANPLTNGIDRWFRWIFNPKNCLSKCDGFGYRHMFMRNELVYKYNNITCPMTMKSNFIEEIKKKSAELIKGKKDTAQTDIEKYNYIQGLINKHVTIYNFYRLNIANGHLKVLDSKLIKEGGMEHVGTLQEFSDASPKWWKFWEDSGYVIFDLFEFNIKGGSDMDFELEVSGLYKSSFPFFIWTIFASLIITFIITFLFSINC